MYKNYLDKHSFEYYIGLYIKKKYLLNFEVTFSKANWSRMIKIRVFLHLENDAMQVFKHAMNLN